jgi:hypothetical protein
MSDAATRLALTILACLICAAPAAAFRLHGRIAPVKGNPANALTSPIDPEVYDPATHCSSEPKPGMTRLVRWMQAHAKGVSWGTFRCEKWGKHEASLHAEGRALDWHLDVTDPADRREARRIIELLLAPDLQGNDHALARRMGVEELIWDCGYWGAGMEDFNSYQPCFNKHGDLRKHVDTTVAHRNHLHIGLSRRGAAAKTSFWKP